MTTHNTPHDEPMALTDDPDLDGTDFAHPAWWRGNDAGVDGAVSRIQRVLNGDDDGSGVLGGIELERVRRRIMDERTARLAAEQRAGELAALLREVMRPAYVGTAALDERIRKALDGATEGVNDD